MRMTVQVAYIFILIVHTKSRFATEAKVNLGLGYSSMSCSGAKDGPTILLESFKSLQGILSNPVALFVSSWFKSLHTVLELGGLRENIVSVGRR